MKNPQVRFGREHFSPVKNLKIYRLILLSSHFYSSGEFPSSGLVTKLVEHFGGNLKNHENHDFQAALAPETRFSSHGRCAAAQCLKWLVEPCSDRVIRGQGGASWHFQNDWTISLFFEVFPRLWKIPKFVLDGSIFRRWRIWRSIVWSYSRLISIPLENFPVPGWWPSWLSILVEI